MVYTVDTHFEKYLNRGNVLVLTPRGERTGQAEGA